MSFDGRDRSAPQERNIVVRLTPVEVNALINAMELYHRLTAHFDLPSRATHSAVSELQWAIEKYNESITGPITMRARR